MSDLRVELTRHGYQADSFWGGVGAEEGGVTPLTPAHREQEEAVLRVMAGREFASMLDVGCGDGRMGELLPPDTYTGIDLSQDRLSAAREHLPRAELHRRAFLEWPLQGRQWDLVACSEVLMHVPHEEFGPFVVRLKEATRRWLLIVDWYPRAGPPTVIAPWCFYHTPALVRIFGEPAVRVGKQGIWLWAPQEE